MAPKPLSRQPFVAKEAAHDAVEVADQLGQVVDFEAEVLLF